MTIVRATFLALALALPVAWSVPSYAGDNPCGGKNPCGEKAAKKKGKSKKNPCGGGDKNPCGGNPCGGKK